MSAISALHMLLLPLSIRNTLKRHRLKMDDVFSYAKMASVLTDRTIADLILTQRSIYRLLPMTVEECRLVGYRPNQRIPQETLDWQGNTDADFPVMCGGYGLLDLQSHYSQQSVSVELKERFEKSITPLVCNLSMKGEYAHFVERMFQKKCEDASVVSPINGTAIYLSTDEDWKSGQAFSIQLTDASNVIISYDETKFPDASNFQQLVFDLLNLKFRLSNYEETVQEMGELYTYYLNHLELKSR